jgi:hypothetical protein
MTDRQMIEECRCMSRTMTSRLDAGHDRLAQIAAELVPATLPPAAHLGVPLLKEAGLGPHDICTRHHKSSTILVILVITAQG